MTILEILQYPNLRLSKKARLVSDFNDDNLQKTIDDMFETLHNTRNCAGLAATQLDIQDPPCITVIYDYSDMSDEGNNKPRHSLCLVNPVVIHREGESAEEEGCMSVSGGVYEAVKRAVSVTVRAWDRHGVAFEITGNGFMAKLLQHEIDHLNGVIFIDRLSRLKRQRIDKRLEKHRKQKS